MQFVVRYLLCYLLIIFSCFHVSADPSYNPYITLKYDSVVIYDYEGGKEQFLFDKNGTLNTWIVKKQIPFSKLEAQIFNVKIGQELSYGGRTAFCFDPHFGVVYYLRRQQVAFVEICLECNRLRSSLRLKAMEQLPHGKGKKIYYLGEGMSKGFRKYLNIIIKKFNFSHQILPGSAFDE